MQFNNTCLWSHCQKHTGLSGQNCTVKVTRPFATRQCFRRILYLFYTNFLKLWWVFCNQNISNPRFFGGTVVQFLRSKPLQLCDSPLKLWILIGSSLKRIKVVKDVWKTCQTKRLSKTLSSDHFTYHFLSLHSLQTNFNNRLQTNQGVVEHPALPVCWTSDVWQSGKMPLPHSQWSHQRSGAATKTRNKVQFKLNLKRQTLT